MKIALRVKPPVLILAVISLLFLFRAIWASHHTFGIESDSGWYSALARNLATRGKYAASMNTCMGTGAGVHPGIFGRPCVQDAEGYVYFPAGITVGPGYVFPQALMLRIAYSLGASRESFWPLQLWPMFAFFLLMLVSSLLIHRWSGAIGVTIFLLWLWFLPQVWLIYAFEAYSEPIAVLFLLGGILFLPHPSRPVFRNPYLAFFLSGAFFSFSILTKMLSAIAFPAFLLALLPYRRQILSAGPALASGILVPLLIFRGYQYLSLILRFDSRALLAVQEEARIIFKYNGSSVPLSQIWNPPFLLSKARIWMDLGFNLPLLVWALLALSTWVLLRHRKSTPPETTMMAAAIVPLFAWFVFLSPTGWARHSWHAIFLSMMLISTALGKTLKRFWLKRTTPSIDQQETILLVVGIVCFLSIEPRFIEGRFDLGPEVHAKWHQLRRHRAAKENQANLETFPSVESAVYQDQKDLQSFFRESVPREDYVYTLGFVLGEYGAILDRVIFPIQQHKLGAHAHLPGRRLLAFGPYQMGLRNLAGTDYLELKTREHCTEVLYSNPSYRVCVLK